MQHGYEPPIPKGEGRLTDDLLQEKLGRGKGPLFRRRKKHGLRVQVSRKHGLRVQISRKHGLRAQVGRLGLR